jgi:hypothetical protein
MVMESEPSNAFDQHAVKLMLNDQKIGYVPRVLNREVNPLTSVIDDWKISVRNGQISFTVTTTRKTVKRKSQVLSPSTE